MFVTTSARTSAERTFVTDLVALPSPTRVDPFASRRRASPQAPPPARRRSTDDGRSTRCRGSTSGRDGRTRRCASAARDVRGQGTVEYVGLILLVAVILAGVVKASGGLKDSTIAEAVIKKLKGAIDSVGEGESTCAAARAVPRVPDSAAMTVAPDEVRRRPVGVFDSGVGGLTVLHELLVRLPHEDYLYLADSARLPYGSRAPERAAGVRARGRRGAARAPDQAARRRVQLGDRRGAARRCASG